MPLANPMRAEGQTTSWDIEFPDTITPGMSLDLVGTTPDGCFEDTAEVGWDPDWDSGAEDGRSGGQTAVRVADGTFRISLPIPESAQNGTLYATCEWSFRGNFLYTASGVRTTGDSEPGGPESEIFDVDFPPRITPGSLVTLSGNTRSGTCVSGTAEVGWDPAARFEGAENDDWRSGQQVAVSIPDEGAFVAELAIPTDAVNGWLYIACEFAQAFNPGGRTSYFVSVTTEGVPSGTTTGTVESDGEIVSPGPLTRIINTADLGCQVQHADDTRFSFYGGDQGACGTFLATDGILYGPAVVPAASVTSTSWTAVSQSDVTGDGTRGSPYQMVTVVEAAGGDLRIEQTDSYVVGDENYHTSIRVINNGSTPQAVVLYRAGDCYLQDSDVGFSRVDRSSPACVVLPSRGSRIQQWEPITPGSTYYVGSFNTVWQGVNSQEPFDNTCLCDQQVDNGGGISWRATIAAGGQEEFSHRTHISPEGHGVQTTFAGSVPGPTEINLDPLTLAATVAIAAALVIAIPFPAALFNATLEENYDQITAGMRRMRDRLGRGADSLRRLATPQTADVGESTESPGVPVAEKVPSSSPWDRLSSFWRTRPGFVAFVAVSALIYSLLDPTFGLNLGSAALFLGLMLGLLLTLLAFGVPWWMMVRKEGTKPTASVLPVTIVIAIVCVLLSRLADFQPGYLYGLIIGFGFARELSKVETGKIEAVATASVVVASIAAWSVLNLVRGEGFVFDILEVGLVTLVVAGIEMAVFGMVPIRFLPGERVMAWNRVFWSALLGVGAFGFFHILLNPSAGYAATLQESSMTSVIVLFALFGVGSVLFWAYFKAQQDSGPAPESVPDQ